MRPGPVSRLRRADDNTRTVASQTVAAVLIRGGGLLLSLVSTPALIRYFDDDAVLGVWYTLLSVLMWVLHFDLGLGNGLRNHLTRALAAGDRAEARRLLSAGMSAIAGVSLALLPVGLWVLSTVELAPLVGAETALPPEVLRRAAMLVLGGMLLRFALGGVTATLYALQYAAVNHLLSLGVSVLQVAFVLTVRPPDAATGLLWLSGAYALFSNLPTLVAGVVIFASRLADCRPRLSLVDRSHLRAVMGVGAVFFACQLLHMLLVSTNEFLITSLHAPAATTAYSVCHKLTSLPHMALTPALAPVWSALTRAEAEGNRAWLRAAYRRLGWLAVGATGAQVVLALGQPLLFRLWLGEDAPLSATEPLTALAFGGCGAVLSWGTILSTLACGLGRLRRQLWCYLGGAVGKLALVPLLSAVTEDWRVVVWCTAAVMLPYCVVESLWLRRFFARGACQTGENVL